MSKEISFHFKGGEAEGHTLSVDYVINLLEGLRDLAYLTVAQQSGMAFNERFRPSKQIKERVVVKCKPAEIGSYSQTLIFDSAEKSMLPGFGPEEICAEVKGFITNLARNDDEAVVAAFPNKNIRLRAIQSVNKAIPPADSDIYCEMDNDPSISSRTVFSNSLVMLDAVRDVSEDYMMVVTGRLTGIDFDPRKLVIQHPVTRRSLDCYYNEEVEPMLLEHPRELIQVTGTVVLDESDMPKGITDVVEIQEVDLSAIEFDSISADGLKLRFRETLSFIPVLDDSQQLFLVTEPRISLDVFAYTRREIIADVQSEIVFLWKEYALADDADLSDEAVLIKQGLLALLEEIPHE